MLCHASASLRFIRVQCKKNRRYESGGFQTLSLPFHMPTGLADGLGLESTLSRHLSTLRDVPAIRPNNVGPPHPFLAERVSAAAIDLLLEYTSSYFSVKQNLPASFQFPDTTPT